MSSKKGQVIVGACILTAFVGLLTYAMFGGDAAMQVIPDVGKFKVGYALGLERAGFSGRPMVMVFTSLDDPDFPTVADALANPIVDSLMAASFVGTLVDTNQEPEVLRGLRENAGVRVAVRSISGEFLGFLPKGFGAEDLRGLLSQIGQSIRFIEKSPIYGSLLNSSAAISSLKAEGDAVKASRFAEMLEEFEGSKSPSVVAAKAALLR